MNLRSGRLRPGQPAAAYDAFISYSHDADGKLAPALQAGLQRLAKPWYRPRALRVFRDDTGLAVSPHLWSSIAAAMERSRYFLLVCSPEAAASPWVNREIEHWLASRPVEHILPVLTGGTLVWDPARGDYDAPASSALPPALVGRFADEPRHLDLRWARDEEQLDLRNSRFRGAVADLAAPLHGMAKDELEGEDVRQHRLARRLARGAVAGMAILLAASLVAGGLAVSNGRQADRNARQAIRQSERAEHEATIARARGLAGQAASRTGTAPDLALLLALEAYRLDASAESRSALLTALEPTAQLRGIVTGFPADESVVGLSEDGATLAVSDPGGRVRLVDVATRKLKASFETGQLGPVDVFFSDDGTAVVTTSEDATVRLWEARSGQARSPVLRDHQYPLRAAALSGDGRLLVTMDASGQGLLWDGASGFVLSRLPPKRLSYVAGVDVSADGTIVALSGLGGNSVIELADGGRSLGAERTIGGSSPAVALGADGTLLAAPNFETRHIDVWDIASGERLHAFPFPVGTPFVALSGDGGTLAAGNPDGTTTLWDLGTGDAVGQPLGGQRGAVEHVSFKADAAELTTASATGVASWDLRGAALRTREERLVPHAPFFTQYVAFSPDGHELATIGGDGQLAFRDERTLQRVGDLVPAGLPHLSSFGVAYSPDGRVVVAGGAAQLSLIDAETRSVDRPPLDVGAPWHDLDFSADGSLLAVGTNEGTAVLVDVERWAIRRRVEVARARAAAGDAFDGREVGVALSPDGSLLATVGNDGRVVLEGVDGDGRTTVAEGKGPAFAVDFSADGRYLAAGFANGTALVIDLQRSPPASAALLGHVGYILDMAFSPDDEMLAVASFGGVTLWDVDTRLRLGVLAGGAAPWRLSFAPDELSLATTWYDNSLIVWELDPQAWRRRACEIAGRNLTRSEWDQYVGAEPYRMTCGQWPAG